MSKKYLDLNKDTRFLVTGAAGFIGSNLVEELLDLGYRVIGVDNFSLGKRENVEAFRKSKNYEFIEGDVRDFELCLKICRGVDYVLHQAAIGSVPRSIKDPIIYEDNNIKGTSNMLEAARLSNVKRFIYASSSSVYGDSKILPKVEGEEGNVISPYALTKKVNEEYGKIYTELYGLECIGLRYFNVFGKRQNPESVYAAVIPKFIKLLKNGEQVYIYGDGEQSRDFTYIDNVVEANLLACVANTNACGKSYNIACGERYTLNEVIGIICNELKVTIEPKYSGERKGDIKHSLASILKSKELLNYEPKYSFTQGIIDTINYYL